MRDVLAGFRLGLLCGLPLIVVALIARLTLPGEPRLDHVRKPPNSSKSR